MRGRRIVSWLLGLAAAYVLLVLLVACLQDTLVFPGAGGGDRGLPDVPGLSAGELQRKGGERFRIVTAEPPGGGPPAAVALYFAGNGEDLHSTAWGAHVLARHGMVVVGVEHAGYGTSAGPPSVATLLGGAEAAAEHARALAGRLAVPLVAVGSSLGSFCAVHVAARGGVERLLLRAPPTTLAAVARSRFFWLPVGLFLRHGFDNLAKAPGVRCPVLVLHGDRDDVVPLAFGRALVKAFGGPAELLVAEGRGHNDVPLDPDGPYGAAIAAFLRGP